MTKTIRQYGILIGLSLTASVLAQDAPLFPKPSYFRRQFATPSTRVELRPPVRLRDYVVADKLELSLRSYLELVLANNTSIAIERLNIETQKNAILRAFSTFDPSLAANFRDQRTKTPTSDVLSGAASLNQLSQPADFTYRQTLETGTSYSAGFTASKTSTNNQFVTFNPALNATMSFSVTQPLLRNRGSAITKLPITIARSRLRVTQYQLRDTVMRLLATAENAYWDVISARENLGVQLQALALRGEALKRAETELRLGALSPLDIYQPQAEYASAEIQVSQARFQLAQYEDALRKQIGVDLDPEVRRLPLELTEPVLPPNDTSTIDREMAVESALRLRPDLRAAIQNLDVDDLNIKSTANALRPDLSLSANYSSSGRGGTFYDRTNVFSGDGTSSTIVNVTPGGFGDALNQLFGFGYPVYGFTLSLRLPLRDRAAQANMADAIVTKKADALRVRNAEQTVRLEVLNAATQVESSKASVRLATIARDLAQKTYEAEYKKYELGTNILFIVLDAQNRLTLAQSRLLTESVNYRRNLLSLLQTTGQLLEQRGVAVQ
jgi:outer membrane protein